MLWARLDPLAGHLWPASHMFDICDLRSVREKFEWFHHMKGNVNVSKL